MLYLLMDLKYFLQANNITNISSLEDEYEVPVDKVFQVLPVRAQKTELLEYL